jgi:ketosteroid isomerase-like protein
MSWPDDVETAVNAIDAWNRGDLPGFLDAWDAEAEWRPAFPQGTEGAGSVVHGHEEISRAWNNARGAGSGLEIDSPWSAVVRFRDGKVLRARDWLDHEHGVEAAEEPLAAP